MKEKMVVNWAAYSSTSIDKTSAFRFFFLPFLSALDWMNSLYSHFFFLLTNQSVVNRRILSHRITIIDSVALVYLRSRWTERKSLVIRISMIERTVTKRNPRSFDNQSSNDNVNSFASLPDMISYQNSDLSNLSVFYDIIINDYTVLTKR